MPKALDDIVVADFSHLMQGPWSTQKLADMGADVIKIEPLSGEPERSFPVMGELIANTSAYYLAMNRNKESIAIDLKTEAGAEAAQSIVKNSDVLVENFRPGAMDRLGLGYEEVKEINEDIIYVSATGFGSEGPYSKRPGQDLLIQAMSGLSSITGRGGDPPTPAGTTIADELAGKSIALHTMYALYYRERSGEGQRIEVNLFDSMIDAMCQEVTGELNGTEPTTRSEEGIAHAHIAAPYGFYETNDGYIAISLSPIGELAEIFDLENLTDDTVQHPYANRDEIKKAIERETRQYDTRDIIEALQAEDILAERVRDLADLPSDPQVEYNDMIIEVDHPDVGPYQTTGVPGTMSKTPGSVESPPPKLGEHSVKILTKHGYTIAEAEELLERGIIETPDE